MSHFLCNPITAGLSFSASIAIPNVGEGWSVTLIMRGPDAIDLFGELVDGAWVFAGAPSVTEKWTEGMYAWQVRATNFVDTISVGSGSLEILPDLSQVGAGHDPRTPNEIALAAIIATLGKRATKDQERYRINNRELYRTPLRDLIYLRKYYQQLVNDEKRRASGKSGWKQVKFHMRPMGSR